MEKVKVRVKVKEAVMVTVNVRVKVHFNSQNGGWGEDFTPKNILSLSAKDLRLEIIFNIENCTPPAHPMRQIKIFQTESRTSKSINCIARG